MIKKAITIPLGYNPANADIGILTQISGQEYEGEYADKPDVRRVIREGTYDLMLLNQSSKINPWAAFKPYHNNYGSQWGMNIVAGSPNDNLVYVDRNAPYELDHWIGYNHQAVYPRPFIFPINYSDPGTYGVMDIRLSEFDFRDINMSIEGIYVQTKRTSNNTGSGFAYVEITDEDVQNGFVVVENFAEINDTAERYVEIFLAAPTGGTPNIIANFPYPNLSGGLYTMNLSINFTPDPRLFVVDYPHVDLESPYAFYYSEAQEENLNTSTGAFDFELKVFDESTVQKSGNCKIWALEPGTESIDPDNWYHIANGSFNSSSWQQNSSQLPSAWLPITDDVFIGIEVIFVS